MITLKLQKHYSKKKLFYSIIVVSDIMKPSTGKFIEKIGFYNPIKDSWSNKIIFVDSNRLYFWVKRGVKLEKNLYLLIKPLLLDHFFNK